MTDTLLKVRHMRANFYNRESAFTMIELLVVLAVIAVLAGLLLPSIGRVKQRSREALCLNNLRQIGIGLKLYHDENRDRFPLRISMRGSIGTPPAGPESAADWWDFTHAVGGQDGKGGPIPPAAQRPLFPYLKSPETFHCRSDRGDIRIRPTHWSVYGSSYTYNAMGPVTSKSEIGTTGLANKNETSFPSPVTLVMMYERPGANWGMEQPVFLWHRAKNTKAYFLSEHYAKGHQLVSPYLFMDGHLKVVIFKNGETPWQSPKLSWK